MLGLILAATLAGAAPAQGTYDYVLSLNGTRIEKTAVTVTRNPGGNLVLSESGSGEFNGRSAQVADTLTLNQFLAPLDYSSDASLADSRSMKATLAFNGDQAVQGGDVSKTYTLEGDSKHFVVLDFGPFTGYFALPAQMQAWSDQPVTAIVPMYARGIPIAVDKALKPDRPASVPAADEALSVASPVQFTIWYDPKTLIVDEVDVPGEGLSVTRSP